MRPLLQHPHQLAAAVQAMYLAGRHMLDGTGEQHGRNQQQKGQESCHDLKKQQVVYGLLSNRDNLRIQSPESTKINVHLTAELKI